MAMQAKCAGNLRQIHTAMTLYAADHDGRMWNAYRPAWYSQDVIGQYLGGTPDDGYGGLLLCPADKESDDTWGLEQDGDLVRGSYTFNAYAISWQYNTPTYVKNLQVRSPSRCVLAGEGIEFSRPAWPDGAWESSYMRPRHNGGCNVLFVDGHISWLSVPHGWEDADVVFRYDDE